MGRFMRYRSGINHRGTEAQREEWLMEDGSWLTLDRRRETGRKTKEDLTTKDTKATK
jgi:hypothetical protein